MNLNWLLQTDVFDEEMSDFISAIERNNCKYHIYKYIPFLENLVTPFDNEELVLTYGSINLVKRIQKTKPWIPGYWANFKHLECLFYYAHYAKFLLNHDYLILPFQEIIRQKEYLYEKFGDPIFIRPDKADKPFTGHLINYHEFQKEINFLQDFPCLFPESTVILSSAKNIKRESRFIASDNKVITGSTYRINDELKFDCISNGSAFDLAEQIAQSIWKPDKMFVIDIAETDDSIGLLEINSFSCSGFYDCDKNLIVQEANKQAAKEFEEYQ